MKTVSNTIYILILLLIRINTFSQTILWKNIESGLSLAIISSPLLSETGDSKITVLKINPENFRLKLVNAKELNQTPKTAKQWSIDNNLIAAINAGMFHQDGLTNVGYMVNFDFVNSSYLNSYNTILAFNRKDSSVPVIQIIDRKCQNWEFLKTKYNTCIQGIRMINCNQNNMWSQQDKKWSMVVIAMDKSGNVLFIFTRSPYSVHNFIDILLGLNLSLYNAMYLEGGPEASFYMKYGDYEIEKFGSFETGFYMSDGNDRAWEIPNVIGVIKD